MSATVRDAGKGSNEAWPRDMNALALEVPSTLTLAGRVPWWGWLPLSLR